MSRDEMRELELPEIPKHFGKNLRSVRLENGLSLILLAQALGYKNHSYLSEIESGKKLPTLELVFKTSVLFNISMDRLVKDDIGGEFK